MLKWSTLLDLLRGAGITVAVAASMGANAAYYAVNVDIAPFPQPQPLGQ